MIAVVFKGSRLTEYLTDIMQGANIASPLLTASIQYILNVALTLPAILYLDRVGRRPAMLTGSFLMMTFLFIAGGLQAGYGQPNTAETKTKQNENITWIVYNKKDVSSGIVVSKPWSLLKS
jgi:hypothetical protein